MAAMKSVFGLGLRSSSSSSPSSLNHSLALSSNAVIRCLCESQQAGEKRLSGGGRGFSMKKPAAVVMKASVAASESVGTSENQTSRGLDLAALRVRVSDTALMVLKLLTKRRPWKLHFQMLLEKVIIDCRFFTLFAVVGSLVGSILCFVEGCFIILESYFQYFRAFSQNSDHGEVMMQLLIEALDMFLIGTAMLIFGMGLLVMFVGSNYLKGKGSHIPSSNLFGLFNLKTLPRWAGMQSVTQAKSNIGHAVMLLLQVGVLEKFKSIPLVTGLDLACFAGAVLACSASIYVLSRLSLGGNLSDR